MTSFSHVSQITILGYTMIGLQEGRHTKTLAQTTIKDIRYFKFLNIYVISSVEINSSV